MKKLRITQVKSGIGYTQRQKRTLKALGISKMQQAVEHIETPQIAGMVSKVNHLIKVEEIETT
ncbi:MAG TPA: 50S ribosomal protein L30 [Bacteroidales bacterium]|nr:50S ribosomal protein L30 [Bacteroidales bacterium]